MSSSHNVRIDKDVHRFGRWAKTYNESFLQSILFKPIQRKVLSRIERYSPSTDSILDIGCGTGMLLRSAQDRFPTSKLYGVDASAEMIESSESLSQGIIFAHGTAESLPFSDTSFSVATTTMSFHHWSDQETALKCIHAKLKPSGIFILADALAAGFMKPFFASADHGRFNSPAQLSEMFLAAGFEIIDEKPMKRFGGTIRIITAKRLSGS
jgi:ubiquinone/menaquinone biosynthesis C-methylase UbiE